MPVILASVRIKLGFKPGDAVIFEESKADGIYPHGGAGRREFMSALEGALSEWNSENDDKAYGDL